MDSNLSNTLGVLIAFSTLMLLYSIVVTSLVQATQAVLRLRSRNLWRVLTKILESERTDNSQEPSKNAFNVISGSTSAVFSFAKDPDDLWQNVFGPDVSWLDTSQLRAALTGSKIEFKSSQIKSICSKFEQTEKASSKRFQFWTRMLSIAWAAAIAVFFQLSTPALLNTLSSDADARKALVEQADNIVKGGASDLGAMFYLEPGRNANFFAREDTTSVPPISTVDWGNVSGVIITVLLLSLGAPFWFNTLKSVVNLKDALGKDDGKASDKAEPEEADVDRQIEEATENIARSEDSLATAALKVKLGDLRVLKAKMLSV